MFEFNHIVHLPKMEERLRSERWGEIETLTMLSIMKEINILQMLEKSRSHMEVFGHISESMAENGYERTAEQIKYRWRNLKTMHRERKRQSKTRDYGSRKPRFFNEMDELFENRLVCNNEEGEESQLGTVEYCEHVKAEDCKERLTNVKDVSHSKVITRTAGSAAKTKRPYKEREDSEDVQTERDILQNVASKTPKDYGFTSPASTKPKKINNYPISIAEANRSAMEYFESRKISSTEMRTDDPDLAFLKSVLPEMKEMNNDQKRRFKIAILNAAGQILNEDESPASPVLSSS